VPAAGYALFDPGNTGTPPGTSNSAFRHCPGLPTTARTYGRISRIVMLAGASLKALLDVTGPSAGTDEPNQLSRRPMDSGRHGPSFAPAGYALFDPGNTGTPPGTSTSTMFTFDTIVLSF
jgi:hypothetical protein